MIDQLLFACELIKMTQSHLLVQLDTKKKMQYNENYQNEKNTQNLTNIKKYISHQIEQAAIMMKLVEEIQQNEELLIQKESQLFKEAFEKEFKIEFKLTKLAYDLSVANYEDVCQKNFGSEFRVAEWDDLEDIFYELEETKIDNFIEYLGFNCSQNDFAIKYNGNNKYSQSRFYFVSWHNHKKPDFYLAHENIDNYLLSLGSWVGSKRILCIKKLKDEIQENEISINEE
ncbi:hypothetical protein ABPG74_001845 [Tetrahymena malaccensis]